MFKIADLLIIKTIKLESVKDVVINVKNVFQQTHVYLVDKDILYYWVSVSSVNNLVSHVINIQTFV